MLKMKNDPLPHSEPLPDLQEEESARRKGENAGLFARVGSLFKKKHDPSLRETLEDYLEEHEQEQESGLCDSVSAHEISLISNVLKIHELTVADVMIPRADIVAIDVETPEKDLLELLSHKQYSRIPVYNGTLDEPLGCIHIKDVLLKMTLKEPIHIKEILREAPIVAPAMRLSDLLWEMRQSRKHMCLVVDEFGGIDGLITIGDLIESVIGEIEDEHDDDVQPELTRKSDGTYIADARVDIETFEEHFGTLLSEEERSENDTLGGLVFFLAGRVPSRGEVLTHETGIIFEILDADPRRVHKIRIKNTPADLTLQS